MVSGSTTSAVKVAFASLAVLTAGACASAPAPPLLTQADRGSLPCATALLQAADYEVGGTLREVVGEVRVMAGEVGVTRERVTATLADGGGTLEVSTAAYRLEPSMHNLPVDRQMASQVTPSPETSELARDIARECAAGG